MNDIVIVSAQRTPVGSFNGALASLPAHDLGRIVIQSAVERAGIELGDVDEVILGHEGRVDGADDEGQRLWRWALHRRVDPAAINRRAPPPRTAAGREETQDDDAGGVRAPMKKPARGRLVVTTANAAVLT